MPLLLVGLAYGVPAYIIDKWNQYERAEDAARPVTTVEPDGAKLFAKNCASCHGERGDSKGVAVLSIPARYFGYEKFKFGTTDTNKPTPTNTAMPCDDDLLCVLRRGIPGSSMPSFAHLSDAELAALVAHVRALTRVGVYERLYKEAVKKAEEGDEEPNPAKIATIVDQLCRSGTPVPVPRIIPPSTPDALANGKRVFTQVCANCHGPEGRGDGQQVKDPKFTNDIGTRATPRDLTQGIFKGGDEPHQIYSRIVLGIPGTPMPSSASAIPPKDMLDLVAYVKSLSAPAP